MEQKIKICPLMSNAEKEVECKYNCAFNKPNPITKECVFVQLVESIDNLADKVQDIYLSLPNED